MLFKDVKVMNDKARWTRLKESREAAKCHMFPWTGSWTRKKVVYLWLSRMPGTQLAQSESGP